MYYNTLHCSPQHYITCSAVQCSAVQCSAVQCTGPSRGADTAQGQFPTAGRTHHTALHCTLHCKLHCALHCTLHCIALHTVHTSLHDTLHCTLDCLLHYTLATAVQTGQSVAAVTVLPVPSAVQSASPSAVRYASLQYSRVQ